jgi:hypothetical protein
MSTPRSASYARAALAFAGICAVCAIGGLNSAALAAPVTGHLFVSDPSASVLEIFSLPNLVAKATIAGLSRPRGLCPDGNGNVWVANYGTQQMFKYSSTGTLTATLNDPSGFPFACSIDRGPHHSHDLAAANIRNTSGPGETEIWIDGVGIPLPSKDYVPMPTVRGEAYDTHSNLFVDGQTNTGAFVLGELPAGSSTITGITVTGGTIHLPGMLQWDEHDHYLAVGDRRCDSPRSTCVYHMSISGSTGTITGKTKFKAFNGHVICDMAQGEIYDSAGVTYLAGGDDESACGYAATSVNRWAFPAGGLPTSNNHSITLTHPFGTAVSR